MRKTSQIAQTARQLRDVLDTPPLSNTERRIYITHIKRLQAENRVLRDVLACERVNRQIAFIQYWQRIRSRWRSTMDMLMLFTIETTRKRTWE